jgi:hypothetical protein
MAKLVDTFFRLFVLKRLLLVSTFKRLAIYTNLMTLAAGLCCFVCYVIAESVQVLRPP